MVEHNDNCSGKAGSMQIGDETYELAPAGAKDEDCIWIDGKRYLKPKGHCNNCLTYMMIDGFEWQEGPFGLDPNDPLV